MSLALSEPQRLFARSRFKFPLFVGGFGSGKTFAGALRAVSLKSQCIGQDVCYYLPTYPLVKDIAIPRFCEVMEEFKIKHTLIKSAPAQIDIPDYRGSIKFRTMDQPERIIGYEVAHSIADELDTLPKDKASAVWNKIIARNRAKCRMANSVGVVTTPEGFRFVHDRWITRGGADYRVYRARTRDNAKHLPEGYIPSLEATYPAALLDAYLEGQFVNMTSGSVYTEFDRVRNSTNERIKPGEPLHIGMDFNVGKMSAVAHVIRDGNPLALDEFHSILDTPAMIHAIRARYSVLQWPTILIYPDASGNSRKSNNASVSDLSLLRTGGFRVCVNTTNPAVRDRVVSMNKAFETGIYKVNPDTCPNYVESLEKQAFDNNGEPDKKSGFDHLNDGGGYFISYKYPVVRRLITTEPLFF